MRSTWVSEGSRCRGGVKCPADSGICWWQPASAGATKRSFQRPAAPTVLHLKPLAVMLHSLQVLACVLLGGSGAPPTACIPEPQTLNPTPLHQAPSAAGL